MYWSVVMTSHFHVLCHRNFTSNTPPKVIKKLQGAERK